MVSQKPDVSSRPYPTNAHIVSIPQSQQDQQILYSGAACWVYPLNPTLPALTPILKWAWRL